MNQEAAPTKGEQQLLATLSARHVVTAGAAAAAGGQSATKQIAGSQGGRDAQNRKIWRKVHDVSIGLDSQPEQPRDLGQR
jgi:hypothetical protein